MAKLNIKQALMSAGANGAGAVAAAKVNDIKFIGAMKPVLRGAAKLVIGAMLPHFLGKGKNKGMVESAAAGWNGVAAIELANGIITKNGTVNPEKKIAIGAYGDVDDNILGVGATDAQYVLDDTYQADEVAGIDDNVI